MFVLIVSSPSGRAGFPFICKKNKNKNEGKKEHTKKKLLKKLPKNIYFSDLRVIEIL